jgi:hypothetical protein
MFHGPATSPQRAENFTGLRTLKSLQDFVQKAMEHHNLWTVSDVPSMRNYWIISKKKELPK